MKIIIDADAVPKTVLAICRATAGMFSINVVTVASHNHRIISENHITVGGDPQEADIKLLNLTNPGDIVVTQDWGLAAIVLGKGAAAISPMGRIFYNETIDFLLEERELKSKFRRSGGRTGGPRKRTAVDDQNFKNNLIRLIKMVAGQPL